MEARLLGCGRTSRPLTRLASETDSRSDQKQSTQHARPPGDYFQAEDRSLLEVKTSYRVERASSQSGFDLHNFTKIKLNNAVTWTGLVEGHKLP